MVLLNATLRREDRNWPRWGATPNRRGANRLQQGRRTTKAFEGLAAVSLALALGVVLAVSTSTDVPIPDMTSAQSSELTLSQEAEAARWTAMGEAYAEARVTPTETARWQARADASDATEDHDLYMSVRRGRTYGPGQALEEINTAANEGQPNLRRDGWELFFWSDRDGGVGGPDIYSAVRWGPKAGWEEPANLGPDVNSAAGETRPSLSWDGTTLYFGSTRVGGQSDIYATTR